MIFTSLCLVQTVYFHNVVPTDERNMMGLEYLEYRKGNPHSTPLGAKMLSTLSRNIELLMKASGNKFKLGISVYAKDIIQKMISSLRVSRSLQSIHHCQQFRLLSKVKRQCNMIIYEGGCKCIFHIMPCIYLNIL